MTDQTTLLKGHTFEGQASKRVSFVLVTKDHSAFIGKALEMARQLVGPEDELIVVDGASTDGTYEIISRYGDLVDVFICEPDSNATHALNKGIMLARGRYIKQITDDDEIYPDAMEQAISVMDGYPDIDILVCGGTRELNSKVSPVYVPRGVKYGKSPADLFRYSFCGVGLLMRRCSFPYLGLFNNFGGATDGEFVVKAIRNRASVKFCRINLFHHTLYEHSYIIGRRREWERDMDRVAKRYCSLAFYVKYKVKNLILRNPLVGRVALLARDTLWAVVSRLGGKKPASFQDPETIVWDGGLC